MVPVALVDVFEMVEVLNEDDSVTEEYVATTAGATVEVLRVEEDLKLLLATTTTAIVEVANVDGDVKLLLGIIVAVLEEGMVTTGAMDEKTATDTGAVGDGKTTGTEDAMETGRS